jgi:hypothetical protein
LASSHTNLGNTGQTWIGMLDLKHNRQWSWSDSSSVDYYNWRSGEPNNAGNEYCVELYSDSLDANVHYRWNDMSCDSRLRAFVCKLNPIWSELVL